MKSFAVAHLALYSRVVIKRALARQCCLKQIVHGVVVVEGTMSRPGSPGWESSQRVHYLTAAAKTPYNCKCGVEQPGSSLGS